MRQRDDSVPEEVALGLQLDDCLLKQSLTKNIKLTMERQGGELKMLIAGQVATTKLTNCVRRWTKSFSTFFILDFRKLFS